MGERLKQRGRIWYAWVPKRGGGTKLVSTNCTDKRAAKVRAGELELEALDPTHAAKSATTIQRVVDDYAKSRVRLNRSEGTMHHVATKAGQLLRLLPRYARDVSHATLERYIDARRAECVRNTTIKKELRVFGAAWKLARRNRLVEQPIDELMPELEDDYEPRKRALSLEEVFALCLGLLPHRAAIVAFCVATSAEWGAVGRVLSEDVKSDCSMVHIRGTKRKSRDRWVPLPLAAQRALLAYAVRNADGGIGGRLFSAWPNARRSIAAACERAGIPRCSPNDLRRTFGTWLRGAGVEPQLIGAAMGHIDSRMAERVYGRLTPDALQRLLADRAGQAPHGYLSEGSWEPLASPATPPSDEET